MNIPTVEIDPTKTTTKFWDCECIDGYIHPADASICEVCNCTSIHDEQPDSRIVEVISGGYADRYIDECTIKYIEDISKSSLPIGLATPLFRSVAKIVVIEKLYHKNVFSIFTNVVEQYLTDKVIYVPSGVNGWGLDNWIDDNIFIAEVYRRQTYKVLYFINNSRWNDLRIVLSYFGLKIRII